VELGWLRCWRHVHAEGEGSGVGAVVPGVAFQGEGESGQALAPGALASRGAAAVDVQIAQAGGIAGGRGEDPAAASWWRCPSIPDSRMEGSARS
jgi:hypothetical protein